MGPSEQDSRRHGQLAAVVEQLGLAVGEPWVGTCPSCNRTFRVNFRALEPLHDEPSLACPYCCGEWTQFESFCLRTDETAAFDSDFACRCGARFSLDAVVGCCPACAIHNTRQVLLEGLEQIEQRARAD